MACNSWPDYLAIRHPCTAMQGVIKDDLVEDHPAGSLREGYHKLSGSRGKAARKKNGNYC